MRNIRLTSGPVFVDVCLVLELLREVFKTLKAHHFTQKPFLKRFLSDFEALPSSGDVLKITKVLLNKDSYFFSVRKLFW